MKRRGESTIGIPPRASQLARMSDDEINTLVTDPATIDALLDDLLPHEEEGDDLCEHDANGRA